MFYDIVAKYKYMLYFDSGDYKDFFDIYYIKEIFNVNFIDGELRLIIEGNESKYRIFYFQPDTISPIKNKLCKRVS